MATIYKKESLDKWSSSDGVKLITTENLVGESDVEIKIVKEYERESSWMFKSSLTKHGDKYSFESPIYVSEFSSWGGCDGDNWEHSSCYEDWQQHDEIKTDKELKYDRNELDKIFNKFINRWIINRYNKIEDNHKHCW